MLVNGSMLALIEWAEEAGAGLNMVGFPVWPGWCWADVRWYRADVSNILDLPVPYKYGKPNKH